jgi:hypothetical protein
MPDTCIRRRLLFACRQTYADDPPPAGTAVGWRAPPLFLTAGPNGIDRALIGRVDEGVVLAFRGTLAPFVEDSHGSGQVALDWINNVEFLPRENRLYPGQVHAGFASSVERLWSQIVAAIEVLVAHGAPNRLYISGHSKGGALAALAGWRALSIAGLREPVRVCTIAAARSGNEDFRTAYQAHGGISCRRYESPLDIVPFVPPGTDTPGWGKLIIRRLWQHLGDENYVPVGTRVLARPTLGDAFAAARRYLGGLGIGPLRRNYLPLLASAHDISSGSGYDALICDGDPGCAHD